MADTGGVTGVVVRVDFCVVRHLCVNILAIFCEDFKELV